jgi:hypothetical protein
LSKPGILQDSSAPEPERSKEFLFHFRNRQVVSTANDVRTSTKDLNCDPHCVTIDEAADVERIGALFFARIPTLLDADGDQREAAVHRVRAASCRQKAGDPSRAKKLDRAAQAGPLRADTRKDVERMLAGCLAHLSGSRSAKVVDLLS